MPRLLSSALLIRRDPRLLKLPPYLSLLCIVVGVAWLLMLPLDEYSRRTYISENALLPGQVHTYFGGSDQNVFRAYRHEVDALRNKSNVEINDSLETLLRGVGLKVGRQNYTYRTAGETHAGENVYAILQAPRGDATEAIVLVAAWRTAAGALNRDGVALALALARYFRRWSLWSKDIVLLVPPDSRAGPQAWVDAYHDAHDPARVDALPLKSGALQGAVALDYPGNPGSGGGGGDDRFAGVHVVYDGVNGQLPNLDLINSVSNIAGGQMGMGVELGNNGGGGGGGGGSGDRYGDRLETMLRGMLRQGLGHASGPHSCFMPYHVDAVTLQPVGFGVGGSWHDEMGLGRLVEGSFRSLNNLLEKLHQSFFFYLLLHRDRFVSIGTYLPSAMLVAANFTIMAIALWVKSGQQPGAGAGAASTSGGAAVVDEGPAEKGSADGEGKTKEKGKGKGEEQKNQAVERDLYLPLALVVGSHFLGAVPLFVFNHLPANLLAPAFVVFAAANAALPALAARHVVGPRPPQHYLLCRAFSLLLLGMFLSALATLNFSLALLAGLLACPLSFVPQPQSESESESSSGGAGAVVGRVRHLAAVALLNVLAPPAVVLLLAGAGASWVGLDNLDSGNRNCTDGTGTSMGMMMMGWIPLLMGSLQTILREAAFGWDVGAQTYAPLVVWCVWWPAWLVGSVVLMGRPLQTGGPEKTGTETEAKKGVGMPVVVAADERTGE